jgi:hypothetical protein
MQQISPGQAADGRMRSYGPQADAQYPPSRAQSSAEETQQSEPPHSYDPKKISPVPHIERHVPLRLVQSPGRTQHLSGSHSADVPVDMYGSAQIAPQNPPTSVQSPLLQTQQNSGEHSLDGTARSQAGSHASEQYPHAASQSPGRHRQHDSGAHSLDGTVSSPGSQTPPRPQYPPAMLQSPPTHTQHRADPHSVEGTSHSSGSQVSVQ